MKLSDMTYKSGAIYSSLMSGAAKIVAFAQQLLIAYYFGANSSTDIYFYLLNLAFLLSNLTQSIYTSLIIPQSMLLRHKAQTSDSAAADSHYSEMTYLNTFLYLILAFLAIFFILLGAFGESAMVAITRFDGEAIHDNIGIFYIILITTFMMVLNTVLVEILVSYKYFILSAATNMAMNLGIVLFILLFHNILGVYSMAIGLGSFSFICSVLLIMLLRRRLNWRLSLFDIKSVKGSGRSLVAILGNQGFLIFVYSFPFYLLSNYQSGVVTVVNYASKLVQAPFAIINQLTAVLQIKFNELYAEGKIAELFKLGRKCIMWTILSTTVLATAIFLLSHLIAVTLYGFNGKMSPEMTQVLQSVLAIYAFTIPFTGVGLVITKQYYAIHKIARYVQVVVTVNIISCAIYYWAIGGWCEIGYSYGSIAIEFLMAFCLWLGLLSTRNKYIHRT